MAYSHRTAVKTACYTCKVALRRLGQSTQVDFAVVAREFIRRAFNVPLSNYYNSNYTILRRG
jgi:hypothetical protein